MNIPDAVRPLSLNYEPLPADSDWQVDILNGNELMAQGHLSAAEQAYLRSIDRSELLLNFAQQELNNTQLDIIHLYVISCTNLGNLYQQWQYWDRAEVTLLQGHQRTISILKSSAMPVAFRWQAMLALQELMTQLSLFYRDAPAPDALQTRTASQCDRLEQARGLFVQTNIDIQNFLNYSEETQVKKR